MGAPGILRLPYVALLIAVGAGACGSSVDLSSNSGSVAASSSSTVGSSTGGASTVGASTGSTSTVGASTGGASTVGSSTGGASTGTGGASVVSTGAGTGGAGGATGGQGGGGCKVPADCPAPGLCQAATCVKGACGATPLMGTLCMTSESPCCFDVCSDLTSDPQNCGACGDKCGMGVCVASTCVEPTTLATPGADEACAIAVDAANVYWTEMITDLGPGGVTVGRVMSVSKVGGAPVVIASGQVNPCGVAVDATYVYWTTQGTQVTGDGTVMKAPIAGGPSTALATGRRAPSPIVVVGSTLYWLELGAWPGYADGAVMKMPTTGGTPAPVATGIQHGAALVVNAVDAYWTNDFNGGLTVAPVSGGMPVEIDMGGPGGGLALDATSVYWAAFASGLVLRVPFSSGSPSTLATDPSGPTAVAVDAAHVYWLSPETLEKVPLGGGAPTRLANVGQGSVGATGAIAQDADDIYWITGPAPQTIAKIGK